MKRYRVGFSSGGMLIETHMMTGPKKNIPGEKIYTYKGAVVSITYPAGHYHTNLGGKYLGTFSSKAAVVAAVDAARIEAAYAQRRLFA
jgi:hypothetical protein